MLTGHHALCSVVNWIQVERKKKTQQQKTFVRVSERLVCVVRWRLNFRNCSAIVYYIVSFIFFFALEMKMASGQTQNTEREKIYVKWNVSITEFFLFHCFFLSFPKVKLFPSISIVHFIFGLSVLHFRPCVCACACRVLSFRSCVIS